MSPGPMLRFKTAIKTIAAILWVSSLSFGQLKLDIQIPEPPKSGYGVSYEGGGDSAARRLGEIRPIKIEIRHRWRSLVPGLTPSLHYCFRGRHSPDQLSDGGKFVIDLPLLYRSSDIYLVRLRQGSEGRELMATSGTTAFFLNAEYPKKDRIPFELRSGPDGRLYLAPRSPLGPGEYVIALGRNSATFWDFGIVGRSQR